MGIIVNITTNEINEKSKKIFAEDDMVIFFNKDELINNLTRNTFTTTHASCYRKMKDVEKKMKKKGIEYYYYNENKLNNLGNKYRFNDERKPNFNTLYFKIKDYNPNIVSYYTYNDYIRKNEDYKYDFIIYLFRHFGLKRISWSYDIENDTMRTNSRSANFGIDATGINVDISTEEEDSNESHVLGFRKFSNTGAIDFFNTCSRRVFWYTYCAKNIEHVVREILEKSDKYFYEYYENNRDIQVNLDNRLNGGMDIEYTFRQNDSHKLAINKMIKISNKYGRFGFSMNNESVQNNTFNKKYGILFYKTTELEKSTLENIIWNSELQTDYINMETVNKRYKELTTEDTSDLRKRLRELQDMIAREEQTLNML